MTNFCSENYSPQMKIYTNSGFYSKKQKINFLFKNTLITQQAIIKMRYSLDPKYRKYVQGYGFLSFARKFGDK